MRTLMLFAATLREGDITPQMLPLEENSAGPPQGGHREAKNKWERAYVADLLKRNHGNVAAAAREAGKYRAEFYDMMKKHDIRAEDYR